MSTTMMQMMEELGFEMQVEEKAPYHMGDVFVEDDEKTRGQASYGDMTWNDVRNSIDVEYVLTVYPYA